MAYYYPIQNEYLRRLVMLSESIHSLDDNDVQEMVSQIALLDEAGQKAMISTLEDEQRQIAQEKAKRGITPEMEMRAIEENTAKLHSIKRDFETAIRKENERTQIVESNQEAENILRELDI